MYDITDKEERAAQMVATVCQNLLMYGAIDRTKNLYSNYAIVMGLRLDCYSENKIEDIVIDTQLKKSLRPIPRHMIFYTLFTKNWTADILYDARGYLYFPDISSSDQKNIKWGGYYHCLLRFRVTDQDAFNKDMSILKMIDDWEDHIRIE